jgi:uncharacterized repeat protein (TIGR01451 family)
MSLAQPTSSVPPVIGIGGIPFNLIDVVRAYNANFSTADLSVTQVDSPDPVKKDKVLTYTVTVRNGGPAAASGVTMTDALPAGVELKSLATTQGSCRSTKAGSVVTVNCAIGGMASGSSATVTIAVRRLTAGTMTNTASVTAQSPADPNATNNTASENTTVTP